jgi:tRNA G46 methylase TrmB
MCYRSRVSLSLTFQKVTLASYYHRANVHEIYCSPIKPQEYKWEREYREFLSASIHANSAEKPLVQFADVGCGFGGLLIRLAQLFPRNLVVGIFF